MNRRSLAYFAEMAGIPEGELAAKLPVWPLSPADTNRLHEGPVEDTMSVPPVPNPILLILLKSLSLEAVAIITNPLFCFADVTRLCILINF